MNYAHTLAVIAFHPLEYATRVTRQPLLASGTIDIVHAEFQRRALVEFVAGRNVEPCLRTLPTAVDGVAGRCGGLMIQAHTDTQPGPWPVVIEASIECPARAFTARRVIEFDAAEVRIATQGQAGQALKLLAIIKYHADFIGIAGIDRTLYPARAFKRGIALDAVANPAPVKIEAAAATLPAEEVLYAYLGLQHGFGFERRIAAAIRVGKAVLAVGQQHETGKLGNRGRLGMARQAGAQVPGRVDFPQIACARQPEQFLVTGYCAQAIAVMSVICLDAHARGERMGVGQVPLQLSL